MFDMSSYTHPPCSNTASTLSVITTGIVSNYSAYTAALDDSISATTLQLNETLPNSLGLVHDLYVYPWSENPVHHTN